MKYMKSLVAIVILASLFSCAEKKSEEIKLLRPVQYQEVSYLGSQKIRTFSGTAKTDKVINLSFRASGIITQLNVRLGQKVRKGELLAKLDNVQARLNYENAISSMNSSESEMNTAKLNLNRIRSLFEKGSASLSDFEAAKNSYKTAQQSFESSKRSVSIQQDQINYGYLYAPENGVISSLSVEEEENISASQSIATLNAGTDMEISLGIPESIINLIDEGMETKVNFTSLGNKEFRAKVTEVSPSVDSSSATYPVKVTVIEASNDIKSGMAANVTFDFGDHNLQSKEIVIPAHAVGEDSDGRFVFLVEATESGENEGIVRKQTVVVGELASDGFQIKSGLSSGQKIATAGLQTLLDGQKVKLQN